MRKLLVLVVFAVGCDNCVSCREEPTFVTYPDAAPVAADAAGPADAATRVGEFTFPDVPIVIQDADGVFAASIKTTITFWNRAVGCELLTFDNDHEMPGIVVHTGAPPEGQHCADVGGCAYYETIMGLPFSGHVFVTAPSNISDDYAVIAHEIGHLLGLAHDVGFGRSVMRPEVKYPIRARDADKAALEERYCK